MSRDRLPAIVRDVAILVTFGYAVLADPVATLSTLALLGLAWLVSVATVRA